MTQLREGEAPRFDASRMLDAYGELCLALARELVALGKAERAEAAMVAVIDPVYDTAQNATVCLRLLEFCKRMRAVTGLPALPKSGTADGSAAPQV